VKNSTTIGLTVFLLLLISTSTLVNPLSAEENNNNITPTAPETLADIIYTVINGIQEKNSPWNVIYDQIFCLQNTTVYDNAITKALNKCNYKEVIFIARLAELNNYTSPTITNSVQTTLENMPRTGSFPITYTGKEAQNSFILYDRYMINMYRYAQDLNITKWDINAAYNDFVKAYNTPPAGSVSGEMLWIKPQQNYAQSHTSRYYDEHAETLSMFLLFSLNGVPNATTYAEDTWKNTQEHWNGTIYGYTGKNAMVECEMGNFAQIITQYQNIQGNIPHYDRVISDLENKLLTKQYNSPGWGSIGVIKHADSNRQNRLYETMGNLIALQMLYPQFTKGNQTNFQNMLTNGWKGLLNSSLFNNNKFSFADTSADIAGNYNDEATILGAMTLFLYGITPQTGSLAINASEERYHDYRTCFQTTQWQFNYTNHSIRIPVNKGTLAFNFGTQTVTQNFPENGIYDIQFSNDWNTITTTTLKTTKNPTTPPENTTPKQTTFTLYVTTGLTCIGIATAWVLFKKQNKHIKQN
jgi:hypothetical protein